VHRFFRISFSDEVKMTIDNAKLLVIGAGVNGSICAVGLHDAGFNATVLARGKRYGDLQVNGIIIEDQFKHTRSVTRLPLIDHLDPADCYDYILLVVRKNQVGDLLPILARNASPNVVFMVNNPSGPSEYIDALGKDRVMLGFVFGAGRREGSVIRAIIAKGWWLRLAATPFGEIDGTITPRLTRLVAILNQAGFHAEQSRHIVDWQATHAAGVTCFAVPLMKYNLDARALAKSKADVSLMVAALRETLDVLQAVGYRVTPRSQSIIRFIPRSLLVAFLQMVLPTRFMEMGGVWHASQAPDEMNQLAVELESLVERSGLPVPALNKLLSMRLPASQNM
jgi:2-dehydropantoate 2-reductase